jgi:hypothetical protein
MSEMNAGWMGCRKCGVAVPLLPSAAWLPGDSELRDDLVTDFLTDHTGHQVTHLYRCEDTEVVTNRPLWDPMATIALQVTDGNGFFILRGERQSINEPRLYHFSAGNFVVRRTRVNIDTRDLRRGLDLELYPHTVRTALVDRFIDLLLELVGRVQPENLDVAFDASDDPSVSIARMPAEVYEALYGRCSEIFPTDDLVRVRKFLDDNRFEDGLLALRVRRETELEQASLR